MIPFFLGVEHLFEVARSLLPPEQRDQPFDITLDFPPRCVCVWLGWAVNVMLHVMLLFIGHHSLSVFFQMFKFSNLKLCLYYFL